MRRARPGHPRWVLSFADLCLLLLGFFVVLSAQAGRGAGQGAGERAGQGVGQGDAVMAGVRAAFGGPARPPLNRPDAGGLAADTLFEPGEAVFRPGIADRFRLIGADAGTRRVVVQSSGADPGVAGIDRFDRWELAAARAAAVARAVALGGIDPARIDLSIAPAARPGRQSIVVRTRP